LRIKVISLLSQTPGSTLAPAASDVADTLSMVEAVEGLRKDERAPWFMDASLVITSEH
jgi:hypothetical protein